MHRNIAVDNVQVPLTLSYHAGGLKVTQDAGRFGYFYCKSEKNQKK